MSNNLLFQYCQKIVVFNKEINAVLLARRKGEADYDGVFSFIGGKMETTDGNFIKGLTREKNEEVGVNAGMYINPEITFNELFVKKDGNSMVLPHYFAIYDEGKIELNDEYDEYEWVSLEQLNTFQPVISTVPTVVTKMLENINILNNPEKLIKI